MKSSLLRCPSLLITLPFLLLSCANPYRENFNSTADRLPSWGINRLAPPSKNPRIVESTDVKTDGWNLFEKGYVMVGFSKFDAPDSDPSLALSQAKSVGAEIVLLSKTFEKTLTETVSVTQWGPSETTEVHETGYTGRGNRPIDRRTEVTTSQSPETVYVPQQVDYYEHAATYWRKLERPVFGAAVQDLSDDMKAKLQSNHGLLVRGVVVDSPAFQGDLLKGDILVKLDGNAIPGAKTFYEQIISKAGKDVTFTVLRGSTSFEKKVSLNP